MQAEFQQRLIRLPEVLRLTGISRSQAYSLAARGLFPAPIKLSERSSAFLASEVDAWIASRIAASRKTAAERSS